MARKCKRKKTITVLQKYGPAKKIRVCASYGGKGSGGRGRKRKGWCVFKGKAKIAHSCFRTKVRARKAASRLKKTCKSRIRIKRGK